jgi:hypothetical protein
VEEFNSSGSFLLTFGASGSGNAQFGWVGSVAVDSSNNIYVVDAGNSKVKVFNNSGTWLRSIGAKCGHTCANGQLSNPEDVAIDSSGNTWVTDSVSIPVQEFNSSGSYVSQFGSAGSGNGQFNVPFGIAIH